jgi:hypothetical protein
VSRKRVNAAKPLEREIGARHGEIGVERVGRQRAGTGERDLRVRRKRWISYFKGGV